GEGVGEDNVLGCGGAEVVDRDGAGRGPAGRDRAIRLALLGQPEIGEGVDNRRDGRLIVTRVRVRLISRHAGRIRDRPRDTGANAHLDGRRRRAACGDGTGAAREGPRRTLGAGTTVGPVGDARRGGGPRHHGGLVV